MPHAAMLVFLCVMCGGLVCSLTTISAWFDVDCHVNQFGLFVKQRMAHLFSNLVAVAGREVFVYCHVQLHHQAVADPAAPNLRDTLDARNVFCCMLNRVDNSWINGVHHAMC